MTVPFTDFPIPTSDFSAQFATEAEAQEGLNIFKAISPLTLGEVLSGRGAPVSILQFAPTAGTGSVDVDTAAWAALVTFCGENGVDGYIPAGSYTINAAPGIVIDPSKFNNPSVDYPRLVIRGGGSGVTTITCTPSTTPTWPDTIVSRPIIACLATAGEYCEFSGITFDGGITVPPVALHTGLDPYAASLVEINGYQQAVMTDVVFTRFAENWDTGDDGDFGHRGPFTVRQNIRSYMEFTVLAPTYREGPFIFNNRYSVISPIFRGPADASNTISTPVNCFSTSSDPQIGGEWLLINQPDFDGAWKGSALNIYIPGDIVYLGGRPIQGAIGTTNTTSSDPRSTGDDTTWGKGVDFGDEIAVGQTRSISIYSGYTKNCFSYSWKINRTAGHEILNLNGDCIAEGGFQGINLAFISSINNFTFTATKIFAYVPESASTNGQGVVVSECAGQLNVFMDGTGSATYLYPNWNPGSTDPRISRRGVVKSQCDGLKVCGRIKDFAGQLILDSVDSADNLVYNTSWDIQFITEVYTTSNISNAFLLQAGSSSSARLAWFDAGSSRFNGLPLVQCNQLLMFVPNPVYAVNFMSIGNIATTISQNTLLGTYGFWDGDASTGGKRDTTQIAGYAADVLGRGGYLQFLTSVGAGDLTLYPRFKVTADGAVQCAGIGTALAVPAPVAGGIFFNDVTNKFGFCQDGATWTYPF